MLKRIAAVALAAVLSLACLSGCALSGRSAAEETPSAVALVLGAHANSRALNLNSPLIRDAVKTAISSFGFVSVISEDGSPDLIAADNYTVPEQYRGNSQLLKSLSEKKAGALLAALEDVRADDAEADTLEALRLAVRALASAPEGAKKEIIAVDTGLSTTGLLDFRSNLLTAAPETIAQLLKDRQALPDLTGITVKWQQLGDVSAPQQSLSPAQVKQLSAIWQAVVEKAGGVYELSATVANPGGESGRLPTVSPVSLPADQPIAFDLSAAGDFETPQFLTEEQVRFRADSDQYLHPEAVSAVLAPLAAYMKEHDDFRLLLIGTTAGDRGGEELSARRAERVKATLSELGVPSDRIVTLGLGCGDPWHIANAGSDGALAAQNRKVVLLSADSSRARALLKEGRAA